MYNVFSDYLFVLGDVPPDASPQVNYHAARGRHRVPGHRHQSSRLVVLRWTLNWGVDFIKQRQIIIRADEQYCLNILIRFIPLPCAGAVDWVMMQSCFGHHFMLVLEKQEKFDGHQQFFAIVQLIGTRKQAENFAYR